MCERCALYCDGHTDKRFQCKDCKADTSMQGLKEHYMVGSEVWETAGAKKDDTLCIGCLEKRLGRRLEPADFDGYDINYGRVAQSDRLIRRIIGMN